MFRGLRRERGLGGLVRNLDRALKNQGFPVEKMPFKTPRDLGAQGAVEGGFPEDGESVETERSCGSC